MEIKKELIKRDIAGDTVLVPVGHTVYEANGLFVLNEVGAFLWDLLPKAQNRQELLEAILAEYEVSEQEAGKDLDAFLAKLEEMGII